MTANYPRETPEPEVNASFDRRRAGRAESRPLATHHVLHCRQTDRDSVHYTHRLQITGGRLDQSRSRLMIVVDADTANSRQPCSSYSPNIRQQQNRQLRQVARRSVIDDEHTERITKPSIVEDGHE